jgi:hypothetical protein
MPFPSSDYIPYVLLHLFLKGCILKAYYTNRAGKVYYLSPLL